MASYEELSPDQQKFIHELKITGNKTIDSWHNFFLRLAIFDRKGDFIRSVGCFFNTFFGLVILFGAVYVIFSLILGGETNYFIISVIAIIVSILFLVIAKQYSKEYKDRDIPNPLRSFFVPFLDLLRQQSAGQSKMELVIDLNPMDDLVGIKPVDKTTNHFNYLSLSVVLPDSCTLTMKITAHGISYLDHYKLKHAIIFSLAYDRNIYQLSGSTGSFETSEKENKIILRHEYDEHSRSKIVDDPGPDYYRFSDIFKSMQGAVEKA